MYQGILHAHIPSDDREELARIIEDYVHAQARINMRRIVADGLPRLYDTDVVWETDRPVVSECDDETGVCTVPEQYDLWKGVREVYETGKGNCKDLVAIRLAERWLDGDVNARAVTVTYLDAYGPGYDLVHVYLEHGDGCEEDPSELCGMYLVMAAEEAASNDSEEAAA